MMYTSASKMVARNLEVCSLKLPPVLALSHGGRPPLLPGRASRPWKHRTRIYVSFPLLYSVSLRN
jgi:hypothetical protein